MGYLLWCYLAVVLPWGNCMVLLWMSVVGPSVADAVTTFLSMLEAAALFSGTSTNLIRQSATLL